MLPLVFAAAAAGAVAVPTGAPPAPDDATAPPKIRTGLVLGLSLGGGIGAATGYPNDSTKIGNGAYYSASGAMFGTSATVLVMGALADYLNFGFWFSHAELRNGQWRSVGNGGGLRVDAFPLVQLYPRLEGLGVFAQFGIGGGNLTSSVPGSEGSAGTQSFIAPGVLYEWSFGKLMGGHFGAGPSLEYDAIFSQSFERHGLVATARFVFYGGP